MHGSLPCLAAPCRADTTPHSLSTDMDKRPDPADLDSESTRLLQEDLSRQRSTSSNGPLDDAVVTTKGSARTPPVNEQLAVAVRAGECNLSRTRQLTLVPADPSSGAGCTLQDARAPGNEGLRDQDTEPGSGMNFNCLEVLRRPIESELSPPIEAGCISQPLAANQERVEGHHDDDALMDAVKADRLEVVQLLLDTGVDLRKDALNVESILMVAVGRGSTSVVRAILDSARRYEAHEFAMIINSVNSDGMSPLFIAVLNGHMDIVLALLSAGAAVTLQDKEGRSVLHCAVEAGQSRIMQALFQHSPQAISALVTQRCTDKLRGTPLHLAVNRGDVNSAKYLIEKCPESIFSVAYIPDRDNGNVVIYCNLLHLVSVSEHANIIEYFTSAICSNKGIRSLIHRTTSTGRTPLHFALLRKQHGYIAALIAAGADLAAQCVDKDKRTRTAIDMFIHQVPSSVEILNTILDRAITNTKHTYSVVVDYGMFLSKSTEHESSLRVLNALRKTGDRLGQNKLLEHPLVESYLFLLWKRLQGPYCVLVVLNVMLALSLSLLVLFDVLVRDLVAKYMLMTLVGCCMLPLVLHEVDCFYSREQPWKYRAESAMKVLCFILIVCACVLDPARECAAFAVLLSWFELILVMSRIPDTGFYMLMFIEVTIKYLKLLTAFFFLIFGFVVAFLSIFEKQAPFHTFLSAMLKTTLMMTNEFEYESFSFHKDPNVSLLSQISTMVVFVVFVVFIGLVLTNLFVAVAVIDIRKLQIIRKRIEFLDAYEKLLLSPSTAWSSLGVMRGLFRVCCIVLRPVCPSWVEAWEFHRQVKPNYKFRIQASAPEYSFRFPDRLNNAIIAKGFENKERMAKQNEVEVASRKRVAQELAKEAKEMEKKQQMKELLSEIAGVKKELQELRVRLQVAGSQEVHVIRT